eukprot:CAMPEP_0176083706 /NCGR_PEP_ID=MMETSP0120_2-20121206/41882_1 /TAXON_ID=160619 /ORGANISM="Kryptoperidinium foliaceum, Strain CCMP 1326" /LENGTH=73 /DNA_ID=CAMNT_0017417497 /DNA_START=31 /DNA_END=248 /DNA_ORIENTATION=-
MRLGQALSVHCAWSGMHLNATNVPADVHHPEGMALRVRQGRVQRLVGRLHIHGDFRPLRAVLHDGEPQCELRR